MTPLIQIILCAIVVGRAGHALITHGKALASLHGWGQGWVGLSLIATVTSLPELAAGIGAVTVADSPNLAIGNALGACLFNLALLSLADMASGNRLFRVLGGRSHLISAGFGVVMLGFVALSLSTHELPPAVLHVGAYSPALLVLYLLALRSVRTHENEQTQEPVEPSTGPDPRPADGARIWRRFALAAAAVLAAGLWLPKAAAALAAEFAIPSSFVGTVLMAWITTLPEMAVTFAAVRLRAYDLAVGNLLGSSLFNIAILALDDAFYLRAPLMAQAEPEHLLTAICGITLFGIVSLMLAMSPGRAGTPVGRWGSPALLAGYLLSLALHARQLT